MPAKTVFVFLSAFFCPTSFAQNAIPTPSETPIFRLDVSEVELEFVVKDDKGRHIKELRATDVEILEDAVPQSITSFRSAAEEMEGTADRHVPRSSLYILLETSNRMYRTAAHAAMQLQTSCQDCRETPQLPCMVQPQFDAPR
jgi:hypothetical protein